MSTNIIKRELTKKEAWTIRAWAAVVIISMMLAIVKPIGLIFTVSFWVPILAIIILFAYAWAVSSEVFVTINPKDFE